jgi:anaerobic selenocysteine-containing dehydrogenase
MRTLIVVSTRALPAPHRSRIFYAPIRSGTDIAFLSGVLLYLINNNKINRRIR